MANTPEAQPNRRPSLRLWPGVVAVALQWLIWLFVPLAVPDTSGTGILGALAAGAAVLVWWLFFSRAPWSERIGAIVLMVGAVAATSLIVHASIANGMMGMLLPIFSIPFLSLGLVIWAALSRRLSGGLRWASMAAAMVLACSGFTLVRTGGISGDADSDFHWRWTPTPEERLLAQADDAPGTPRAPSLAPAPAEPREPAPSAGASEEPSRPASEPAPPTAIEKGGPEPAIEKPIDSATRKLPMADADSAAARTNAEWPGFRGPNRDGTIRGIRIETDWSQHPPVELWRRPIGPGWSSFAVNGDLIYTQEQRGEDEVVSAYRLSSGELVWRHRDAVRFWESNAGAGPRGTPTLHGGRVYTQGATGIVNALDARTGAALWSRNAAVDTGKEIPDWGFASSPLVIDDFVIVAAAGQLVAYDARTGEQRWVGASGGGGYSSPHLATIDGVPQILLLRGARTLSVAPASGSLLWEHSTGTPAVSILQPALVSDSDVLIADGDAMGGNGMRRIGVVHGPAGWSVEERWASRGLKPYFNDFVVHNGHAFGFDGSILACIDVSDGTRKWKGGRYGHGQLVLLPEQDVLLVLSEDGELALVRATADQFTELARVPAIQGKTWNHPVLVGDVLLVRNGEEMAAFRLSLAHR